MFCHKIRAGHFLEWARVFDNLYGTPLRNVRDLVRSGKSVLLCIDVQGAKRVQKTMKDAVTIFVRTADMDELRRRLEARGTDPAKDIRLRLETAARELKEAKTYTYVIVNDDLRRASAELEAILLNETKPSS